MERSRVPMAHISLLYLHQSHVITLAQHSNQQQEQCLIQFHAILILNTSLPFQMVCKKEIFSEKKNISS